jgi:tetratricopeptide (TPR) repeat protein
MDPERFETVKRLLGELEGLSPDEQARHLDRECAGDSSLRGEVESLLAAPIPAVMHTGALAGGLVPDAPDDVSARGRRIGPYRLIELLGEGGMGVVYRAEQTSPIRREVALKIVPSGFDTARVIARFESERQALALMNHPFIAQALDAGESDDGRPYFVMELVEGEPVTTYCAREKPPITERLKLFLQICDAIQHAHQRGIIHRDLKPSNVLVTRQDGVLVPKVIDFGIAKAVGEANGTLFLTTADGQIVGTPEYMSPEQAGLVEAGLDTRTDVYSLGVMLYELVSGRRPYELRKRTAMELERALRLPLTPPSRLDPRSGPLTPLGQIARDIDAVALMAMERRPDDRYTSVEQLADDVRRVLEHRPVRARQQTWTYRGLKFVRRHAIGVGTAALFAGLATAAATAVVIQRNRAVASEARAVAEASRAHAEAAKAAEVARFLTDLFRESDPAQARGASRTAREILDRGAARLSTELASQTDVRATLMRTIGEVYRASGLLDESEKITTEALAILREGGARDDAEVAQVLDNLGQLARERTRYDQAARLHREALAIRRAALGPRDPAVGESLSNLALALREQGLYDEAEPAVREALAIRRDRLGPEHDATLASMNVLGDIEASRGRFTEADRWYREVLEIRRRTLPPDHPRLATSLNNVAGMSARAGRLEESEALYREALAIRRKVLAADHLDVTTVEVNLAGVLHDLGRLDEAEPLLRQALAADRRRNGNLHMDVAIDLNNLASLVEDLGRLDEAESLYEESLAIRVKLQGESHPSVPTVLSNIGRLRLVQGSVAEAERTLRRAIEIRRTLNLNRHPRQALTLLWLGRVHEARGQLDEATRRYQEALAIDRAAAPTGSLGAAAILATQGRLLVRQRQAAAAEPLLREALAYRQKHLPAGHPATGDAEAALAACLVSLGRTAEAQPLLASALKTAPEGPTALLYDRQAVAALLADSRPVSSR